MSAAPPKPDQALQGVLEEIVGYLNFSGGTSDPKFLRNLNQIVCAIEGRVDAPDQTAAVLCDWLQWRLDALKAGSHAFEDVTQGRAALQLTFDELLPAYCKFHRDLLWHQPPEALWRPLVLGRAFEAILAQGGPWNEVDRIVSSALDQLNDYVGYRPVAVLESEEEMEPYSHEWVRPIPLFIDEVGVACGPYAELIDRTLAILKEVDPNLLRQAWFDLELLEELALDPRAYDFDHPVNKRPNYHFGQWDPHHIDNRGYYRRFVLQQISVDSLMARVQELSEESATASDSKCRCRGELLFEAAAVLAGTILMASGTSGNGPTCHSSDVTLSALLPHIAAYRDQFYEELLARVEGSHGERLRAEAQRMHQPFGGARQHLNHELARRRATQMQLVHLAQLYARMGYPEAALRQAHAVRITSARMLSEMYCRLTAGHHALDAHRLEAVAGYLPEIEDLLRRGIECGALVDPWNIVGFGGNFSLFPALENTIHDYRVDDLVELVEQILDLCARAWSEAAAVDDAHHESQFSDAVARLVSWWDKYATASVSGVKRLVGKEIEISANLVAGALNAWHKAGAAAGDVAFWRMFVDQFDTPKAFALVIEALLDKEDEIASMALMLQWVSQADRTPLEEGDASFHPLAIRWLRLVQSQQLKTGVDQWPVIAKFFARLEASAEEYWQVPEFDLRASNGVLVDEEFDEEDFEEDEDDRFDAAYEGVVYRDSTDDGFESEVLDQGNSASEAELEQESERLRQRLAFLVTVARLWKHVAVGWDSHESGREDHEAALAQWHRDAAQRCYRLLDLLETVHQHRIPHPIGSHDSMLEYDRQRMVKESILEQIASTSVEMSDASRLLCAAAGETIFSQETTGPLIWFAPASELLRSVLRGDAESARRAWGPFVRWIAGQQILYVPLAKGGSPRKIVRARATGQLVHDLLGWMPQLGLIRETCQLLDLAQAMERDQPAGPGAVTEYDRLFASGYRSMVRCVVASANLWDNLSAAGESPHALTRPSDGMLVEFLQDLTESQLGRWLHHSRTLRLSVVEKIGSEAEWKSLVAFVEKYGKDLFTQKFLNLGNLRAILHQRVGVWLSNMEDDPEGENLRLIQELDQQLSRDEAIKWLTLTIEAIVENYREYRDYNSTTTQSDHGEMIYMLIDFLRVRAGYDRVAWNLKPVVMAHEILVRQNRPAAAELWQQALAERTGEAADEHQARFEALCEQYGMQLRTVAERLAERFTRPLAIDRVRALVAPAIEAADVDGDPTAFAALERETESLLREPTGAGLDVPDWLLALEEEVTRIRYTKRHRESAEDVLPRIGQICLSWEELQDQLTDEEFSE